MWMKTKGPDLKPTDSNFNFSDLSSILLSVLSAREGKKLPSRNFSVRVEALSNPNLSAWPWTTFSDFLQESKSIQGSHKHLEPKPQCGTLLLVTQLHPLFSPSDPEPCFCVTCSLLETRTFVRVLCPAELPPPHSRLEQYFLSTCVTPSAICCI